MKIKEIASAKINLFLEIIGKRPDGYHQIKSIFQKISLSDTLLFSRRPDGQIVLQIKKFNSAIPDLPTDQKNLIVRTARIIQKKFSVASGVNILLKKRIPVGAGLGGGSSDAAATIRGLNKLWNLKLSLNQQLKIAREIGADVSFFLYQYCWAEATGVGEQIIAGGKTRRFYLVIIKPEFSIATARAYSLITPQLLTSPQESTKIKRALKSARALNYWASLLFNRFENILRCQYPDIVLIKQMLVKAGALNALLSGSGSAVFGIFPDKKSGERAAKRIKKNLRPKTTVFLAHSI